MTMQPELLDTPQNGYTRKRFTAYRSETQQLVRQNAVHKQTSENGVATGAQLVGPTPLVDVSVKGG